MLDNLPDYKEIQQLHAGNYCNIFRAKRISDNQNVILKIHTETFPTNSEFRKLAREFTIGSIFNDQYIIKYNSLERHGHRLAITLEDFNGLSLDKVIPEGGFELLPFLNIAISLAKGLNTIHQNNIIHKDIKPENILFHPDTNAVKFVNFGSASQLDHETQWVAGPNNIEGSLSYMSPEQTGRMNRVTDYRTDFYSLGITFYELLCGHLPFQIQDPLELLHCHIARPAPPLHKENPQIPEGLSNIVMKLLAKNAEDRYQSAYGLKIDLQTCLRQLETGNKIENFTIGTDDFPNKFQIHQKLYGRDKEISLLLNTFNQISEGKIGSTLMLVYGYSGIGKTSLINEVHKPLVKDKGYFISGKFDQFKRNIPYSSFIQAFQGLLRQLLAEGEERISYWKSEMIAALGKNAQVIIDVIPEVETLIGPQAPVPVLGAIENQNRFNQVFQNFSSVFARQEHPLVIFLDDLQWADLPTLNLLNLTMTEPESQYLFFIGAYRDNEVDASHPLMRILQDIEKINEIKRISLQALLIEDVKHLISDSLQCPPTQSRTLTELVYRKTEGNPFFVTMFLRTLYQKKLIQFDSDQGKWTWDTEKTNQLDITDNVIELMIGRIQMLPGTTIRILALAACIGNRFNLKILSLIYSTSSIHTFRNLWMAIQEGLILPIEGEYKWIEHSEEPNPNAEFCFLHDRVQQAAYSFISPNDRRELHLQIGRLLLENYTPTELNENIFEVVNHLNSGKELLTDLQEKNRFSQLTFMAARKAKISSAYAPALSYISTGRDYLPKNSWEINYPFTLSLYLEKGEIEYLNADWDQAITTFDEALTKVNTLLERCKIFKYKIILYRMKNDLRTALDVGIHALDLLGISVKAFPDESEVNAEISRFSAVIADKDAETLYRLPELEDDLKLVALEIFAEFFAPAYFLGSRLISIIGIKMTEITIQAGNNLYSAVGYIFYSAITLAVNLRDYDNAYKFGKLALRLNDQKYHEKVNEALILDMWGTFICHHKDSIDEARDVLLKGYFSGVENGAYQWAGYCGMIHLFTCFWGVNTLGEVSDKIKALGPGMQKIDPNMVQFFYAIKASVSNLQQPSDSPTLLSEIIWKNMNAVLKTGHEQDDLFTLFVDAICRISLANWYGDGKTALEYANIADRYAIGSPGVFINPVFYFHQSLAYSQAYATAIPRDRTTYLEKINSNLSTIELWASHSPGTYLHQALLVKAELERIQGNPLEAMDLFDLAIESAQSNGFVQNEALANELAARFYLSRDKKNIFEVYIQQAHYSYIQWGALAKADLLQETYPQIFTEASPGVRTNKNPEAIGTQTGELSLDLASVIKSTQAISSESYIDNLLKSLMSAIIENAGAQKASLIIKQEESLFVKVMSNITTKNLQVLQNIRVEESQDLCPEIINYVARTNKVLVLANALTEGDFQSNPYITRHQIKSILCAPIVHQRTLKGVVYLENNLTEGAFTSGKVKVLEILAAQAAISIENSLLYMNLESKVEKRTNELKEANNLLQQEIMERQRTETALRKSETEMRLIMDGVPALIACIGNDLRYKYANRQYMEGLNISHRNIEGLSVEEVIGKQGFQNAQANFQAVLSGEPSHLKTAIPFSQNEMRHFEVSLIPEVAAGTVIGFFALALDVTEQITAEKQLKSTQAQLLQSAKLAAIGELATGVAHELNQPLSYIRGEAQLEALNGAENINRKSAFEAFKTIEEGTFRMEKIITHLRDFARREKEVPELEAIQFSEILESSLVLLNKHFEELGVEIKKEVPKNLPAIMGNRNQLEQVIMNLFMNARDALQETSNPEIQVTAFQEGESIVLTIHDNGPGIPPDIRPRIFDPFFTTKEVGQGTGLGLSISYGIIRDHGGEITILDQEQKGTAIKIILPMG